MTGVTQKIADRREQREWTPEQRASMAIFGKDDVSGSCGNRDPNEKMWLVTRILEPIFSGRLVSFNEVVAYYRGEQPEPDVSCSHWGMFNAVA
jgi:hypothetical protein